MASFRAMASITEIGLNFWVIEGQNQILNANISENGIFSSVFHQKIIT